MDQRPLPGRSACALAFSRHDSEPSPLTNTHPLTDWSKPKTSALRKRVLQLRDSTASRSNPAPCDRRSCWNQ